MQRSFSFFFLGNVSTSSVIYIQMFSLLLLLLLLVLNDKHLHPADVESIPCCSVCMRHICVYSSMVLKLLSYFGCLNICEEYVRRLAELKPTVTTP
jgi:hypothetical protein